ncbi:MAG: hypothetical protein K8W52_33890 [Deltaproteobacteria bacterium]|nr:hypothetical protein [Deltaproteobacteria bacterium]
MQSPSRRAGIFYLCIGLLLVAFGTLSHAWVSSLGSSAVDVRVGLVSYLRADGAERSLGEVRFLYLALVAYWTAMATLLVGAITVIASIGNALEGRMRPEGAPLPWMSWARVCGWLALMYAVAVAGVVAALISYPIMPGASAAIAFAGGALTMVGARKLDRG